MYIKDGIVHAGEPALPPQVCGVRPLYNYKLWVRFDNGEARIMDMKPLLAEPCYQRLANPAVFRSVYIDYHTVVWLDGKIDIDPRYLYENSVLIPESSQDAKQQPAPAEIVDARAARHRPGTVTPDK